MQTPHYTQCSSSFTLGILITFGKIICAGLTDVISRAVPVRLSSFPGTLKNNANRIQEKVFKIKLDSFIRHADIKTGIVIQDSIDGNFGAGFGQSGIDDQRAVGAAAKAKESVGDDRGQKGTFVKLVIDAEPAAGAAAIPMMVIIRHRRNIKRLLAGTEDRIWKDKPKAD
jgi:hypothetical protein